MSFFRTTYVGVVVAIVLTSFPVNYAIAGNGVCDKILTILGLLPQETIVGRPDAFIDKKALHQWLSEQPEELKQTLHKLAYAVRLVSHEEFKSNLFLAFEKFLASVETNRRYFFPSEDDTGGRSVVWTTKAFLDYVETKHPHLRDRFFVFDLRTGTYSERMSQSDEWVIIDDASYSGTNMSLWVGSLQESFHVNVVTPYITGYALDKIHKARKKTEEVRIYSTQPMETLTEIVRRLGIPLSDLYKIIRSDFPYDGMALTFFSHKIPDGRSFPMEIEEGKLYRKSLIGYTTKLRKIPFLKYRNPDVTKYSVPIQIP